MIYWNVSKLWRHLSDKFYLLTIQIPNILWSYIGNCVIWSTTYYQMKCISHHCNHDFCLRGAGAQTESWILGQIQDFYVSFGTDLGFFHVNFESVSKIFKWVLKEDLGPVRATASKTTYIDICRSTFAIEIKTTTQRNMWHDRNEIKNKSRPRTSHMLDRVLNFIRWLQKNHSYCAKCQK